MSRHERIERRTDGPGDRLTLEQLDQTAQATARAAMGVPLLACSIAATFCLLEQVSGVSSISTGTAIVKPVIQGMYGNRILIINNGTRQTGQQWGKITSHAF